MASKRFYSKTVKGSMTEGKNLQELYEELNAMSDADREARISEIDAEIEEIARLMLNRQMNSSTNAEKTQSLIGRVEKLKKEQKMLKLFPKVKKKLKKIAQLYRRAKKEKTRKQNLAQGKYLSLRAELRRREEQIKKYDQEIEEAKEMAKTAKGQTTKRAMEFTINYLEEEKAKISDLDKLREEVKVAKDEFNVYNFRKSEEDQIMHKCRLPWENLLNGMDWKDISVISNQRLSEMAGMKRKEKVEPEQPQQEGQGEEELPPEQEQNQEGQGQQREVPPIPPASKPEQPQQEGHGEEELPPEQEQGEEQQEQEENQEEQQEQEEPEPLPPVPTNFWDKHPRIAKAKEFIVDGVWGSITSIFQGFTNRFKRKEKVKGAKIGSRRKVVRESIEAIMDRLEEETDIRKLKGVEQQLLTTERDLELKIEKLEKKPEIQEKLRTMIKEEAERLTLEVADLKTLQSTAAIYIGQGMCTRSEMEELIFQAATREGVNPSTVTEMITPDKCYIEGLKDTLDKQKKYFLLRDIEEREDAWRIAGISEEEIEGFRQIAQENQVAEDKKVKEYKEDREQTSQRRKQVKARIDKLEGAGEEGEHKEPEEVSLKDQGKAFRARIDARGEGQPKEPVILEIDGEVTEAKEQQEQKSDGREPGDD